MSERTFGLRELRQLVAGGSLLLLGCASGGPRDHDGATVDLLGSDALRAVGVTVEPAEHLARKAVRVMELRGSKGPSLAVVNGVTFANGSLEIEVAGKPRASAGEAARGFIGIAFRLQEDGPFECFYIRPTNGRANDQLRRNHATQYISYPEYPWERLRRETPGVYESYVDLETGVWTRLRVDVNRGKAQLYVNGSEQPVLIVNDLKHPERAGGVALWIGAETEAYFRGLRVTHSETSATSARP